MGVSLGELPYCVEGQSIVLGKYGGIFLDFSCFYFHLLYWVYMQCFRWGPKRQCTLSYWPRILEYCYTCCVSRIRIVVKFYVRSALLDGIAEEKFYVIVFLTIAMYIGF